MFVFFIAISLLVSSLALNATHVRSLYYAIPSTAALLFFFSGMLVKPDTLPSWTQAWMPSVSIMRWYIQSAVVNESEYGPLFPTIGNFSVKVAFLGLLGWNGKTKYYCLHNVAINLAVFFGFILIALIIAVRRQRGRRMLRMPDEDHRLF